MKWKTQGYCARLIMLDSRSKLVVSIKFSRLDLVHKLVALGTHWCLCIFLRAVQTEIAYLSLSLSFLTRSTVYVLMTFWTGSIAHILYAQVCDGDFTFWIKCYHHVLLYMVDKQCGHLSCMSWVDRPSSEHSCRKLPQQHIWGEVNTEAIYL